MGSFKFSVVPPELVMKGWKFYGHYILSTMPEHMRDSELVESSLMTAINSGGLIVNVMLEDSKLKAVFTTTVKADELTDTKVMVIYSLAFVKDVGIAGFKAGVEYLRGQAKALKCTRIIGYTDQEMLKNLYVKKANAAFSWLMEIPVWEPQQVTNQST